MGWLRTMFLVVNAIAVRLQVLLNFVVALLRGLQRASVSDLDFKFPVIALVSFVAFAPDDFISKAADPASPWRDWVR